VLDTQEAIEGLTVHRARVVAGEVRQGQPVEARVDPDRRLATARSHSATHVLHATIKEALGEHAQQAGSLVQPGRLRFDFPHFEQVSRDRLLEIEATINERVLRDPTSSRRSWRSRRPAGPGRSPTSATGTGRSCGS
jgi:alanyl-tRNA synthetase